MKLATATRDVETSAQVQHQSFKIGDSNKMFALLADKIYSDKPRAVIREIACNALDAHLASGVTTPFKISVPSSLEPMLTIRDFGKGLSHAEIMGLYTTFFDSTKGETNDQIGGFGLGSKSPFAYTDAFTVVSIQQGVKRLYAAFRGADGIPQISLAEEKPTNELDGMEIKVPVRRDDYATFKTTAADVLRWFPEGSFEAFGFTIEPVEWLLKTDSWGLIKGDGNTGRTYNYKTNKYETPKGKALMGPVAYEIDWSMASETTMVPTIISIFPIGALDLPPSRETLSYDPTTVQAIKDMANKIRGELPLLAYNTAKALDPWDRVKFVSDLKTVGVTDIIARVYNNGNRTVSGPFSDMTDGFILRGFSRAFDKGWGADNLSRKSTDHNNLVFKPSAPAVIVFDDIPDESPVKKRLYSRLQHDGEKKYIVVCNTQKEYKDYDHFLETFGKNCKDLSFIKKLSEMELPPALPSTAGSSTYQMVIKSSEGGSGFYDYGEKPQVGDVWWPLKGHDVDEYEGWLQVAPYLGNQKVIGLTKTAQRAVNLDDFTKADVWVQQQIDTWMANPVIVAEASRIRAFNTLRDALNLNDEISALYNALAGRADRGAALWPDLGAKLQVLNTASRLSAEDYNAARALTVALENKKINSLPANSADGVYDLMVKALNKSDLLKLAVSMRRTGKSLLDTEYDALIKKMV